MSRSTDDRSADARSAVTPAARSPLQPWEPGDEWTNAATGITLLVERAAGEAPPDVISWIATYPACSPAPPLHFHPQQTEIFTVLGGRMRITHRDVTRDLATGESVRVERGEAHAMWNPFSEPAVTRWETSPALRTEQWMGMLLALAAAGETNAAGVPRFFRLAVLLAAHRAELRLCRPSAFLQALILRPAAWLARLAGVRADRV